MAWDLYVGTGTLAFAWCLLRHPAFRWWLGVPGMAIALLLLGLNVATFPAPPADAGSFDAGPLVGLWYLAVSVRLSHVVTLDHDPVSDARLHLFPPSNEYQPSVNAGQTTRQGRRSPCWSERGDRRAPVTRVP